MKRAGIYRYDQSKKGFEKHSYYVNITRNHYDLSIHVGPCKNGSDSTQIYPDTWFFLIVEIVSCSYDWWEDLTNHNEMLLNYDTTDP